MNSRVRHIYQTNRSNKAQAGDQIIVIGTRVFRKKGRDASAAKHVQDGLQVGRGKRLGHEGIHSRVRRERLRREIGICRHADNGHWGPLRLWRRRHNRRFKLAISPHHFKAVHHLRIVRLMAVKSMQVCGVGRNAGERWQKIHVPAFENHKGRDRNQILSRTRQRVDRRRRCHSRPSRQCVRACEEFATPC